nr:multiheme c-type cytochrome [Rhodopirellula sp. SM50]
MNRFQSLVLISLILVLVLTIASFGELSQRSDETFSDPGSVQRPIRAVVFPPSSADGVAPDPRESARPADATPGAGLTGGSGLTYVGRKVCGECHRENFDAHAQHGHASTFFEVADTDLPQIFAGETFDGGPQYGVYSYQRDAEGNLLAKLDVPDPPEPLMLQYALGSGFNAQTFLTLQATPNGETSAIEHRVSCYAGDRLGLTVGHEEKTPASAAERFGSPLQGEVLERCIYCHTTTATVRQGHIANLTPNVDCEKCHGPGGEHVRLARLSPKPAPYSVGMETWDRESELQLCGDCHRLPRSISKLELRDYPDTLVRFQPVGMLRSKCYLKSEQSLRCTTCHSPHVSHHGPDETSRQIKNCIQCHDQTQSSHVICPVSPQTDCIDCHMPAIDQKQGIKFHDHWIRVRD